MHEVWSNRGIITAMNKFTASIYNAEILENALNSHILTKIQILECPRITDLIPTYNLCNNERAVIILAETKPHTGSLSINSYECVATAFIIILRRVVFKISNIESNENPFLVMEAINADFSLRITLINISRP